MKNNKSEINAEEAKAALESIKQLEHTSLQHALPSPWFGIAISILVGLLIFLIGAGLRDYYVFPIIGLPILMAIQRSKMKVSLRAKSTNKKSIIALLCLIGVMVGLIFAAIFVRSLYGTITGPIVCGLLATAIIYWLSVSEHNEHKNKIKQDLS
jgi:hypothetical protein